MHILHAHSKGGMGIRDEIITFCDGSGIAPFVIDLDKEFNFRSKCIRLAENRKWRTSSGKDFSF